MSNGYLAVTRRKFRVLKRNELIIHRPQPLFTPCITPLAAVTDPALRCVSGNSYCPELETHVEIWQCNPERLAEASRPSLYALFPRLLYST